MEFERPTVNGLGRTIRRAVALSAVAGLIVGVLGATAGATTPGRSARGAVAAGTSALRVMSISPSDGTAGISPRAPITIEFSAPLAARSPLPTIDPSVTGTWRRSGARLVFQPSEPFIPLSQVTVSLPGGRHGLVGAGGQTLAQSSADNFTIENGSTLRLQQLLSLLDYSPLAWTPTGAAIAPSATNTEIAALFTPPAGTFTWRTTTWPASLRALWLEGQYNVFTRGLVMSFQADHGLIVNGKTSAGLWNDLVQALSSGVVNTGGYNYAVADKRAPQSLSIWHDGAVVLKAAANTGIPQSPTPSGTFPVYARYRNEIMRGKNPNGTSYADPVQYVAYFYDGDAVHYFPRSDYGVPQSLGCVELALPQAAAAWPYLAYGTLVTVLN